jgi:hypothetical protein
MFTDDSSLYGSHLVAFITKQAMFIQSNTTQVSKYMLQVRFTSFIF